MNTKRKKLRVCMILGLMLSMLFSFSAFAARSHSETGFSYSNGNVVGSFSWSRSRSSDDIVQRQYSSRYNPLYMIWFTNYNKHGVTVNMIYNSAGNPGTKRDFWIGSTFGVNYSAIE